MLAVKSNLILVYAFILGIFPSAIEAQSTVSFKFNLQTNSSTSGGVFAKDGTLIRTLWGGVQYQSGTHVKTWDGRTDDGQLAPPGNYDIRVLSNNVQYTWEGVVGNTSASFTGPSVYRAYLRMYSMAINGTTAYASSYYNEGNSSQIKFNTADPNGTRMELSTYGQSTMFVATDDNTVFWAGDDALGGHNTWFVFATRTSDDNDVSFAAGTSVQTEHGRLYGSSIDVTTDPNKKITGMAVQKNGPYLFVAHQNINEIHVIDKMSGNLHKIISTTAPTKLAVDGNDNLWVVNQLNNTINKYLVGADGSLNGSSISISNVGDPVSLAISPDNSTVVAGDGSKSSQQLKAFATSDGSPSWIYGQAGGYYVDANVQNDRLYFTDTRGNHDGNFITYQPDGTFWVEDGGNYRAQHFTASRIFINNVMYFPSFYSTYADPNNPTRLLGDYLEFKIDYSKALATGNGSWILVKNWGAGVPQKEDNSTRRLCNVMTLPNGKTYAFLIDNSDNDNYEVVELPQNGPLRMTGKKISSFYTNMYPDGSLRSQSALSYGTPTAFYLAPLTGFDGSNNPVWGPATVIALTPPTTDKDPVYHGNGIFHAGEITTSNVIVSFDNGIPSTGGGTGYHLGGINKGSNTWLWRTSKSTYTDYNGPWPSDGGYDIGNGVNYGGSVAIAVDRNIFWGYHGEFWKASQTNYWDHFWDDGLYVGQMGTFGHGQALYAMAGNAIVANMVKDGSGNLYLYHNDEGGHGGIHRWKISNLSSITEQSIPITYAEHNGGLLARYFDGSDLNNFHVKKTRIDTSVSVSNPPSQLSDLTNFSARWTGFAQPANSEKYTFYVKSNNKVRLWVDDNLVIDQWNNAGNNEFNSAAIPLFGGKPYSVRLDYANENSGRTASVSWSSASQPKEIIPATRLFPADEPDTSNGIDLLEGLPWHTVMPNNLYGWKKSNEEDTTGPVYQKWWSTKTANKAYDKLKSPDVTATFVQQGQTRYISRDLGEPDGKSSQWKLSGHISYENDQLISWTGESYGGNFFEVVDDNGKIIVRFETYIDYQTGLSHIVINHALLASAATDSIIGIHRNIQPIDILCSAGNITIRYGNFAAITTTAFDLSSNWQKPKSMSVIMYSNGSTNTQSVNIIDMRYFNQSFSLLPINLLSFRVQSEATIVELLWKTSEETNAKSFLIEKSTDSKSFAEIGNLNAHDYTGVNNYTYKDLSPSPGPSYYRLRITDVNGNTVDSKTIAVTRKRDEDFIIFPNPSHGDIRVQHPQTVGDGKISIIASDGKSMDDFALKTGTISTTVDINKFPPGYYVLKYNDGTRNISLPFLKY